jgi:hypothetical protein
MNPFVIYWYFAFYRENFLAISAIIFGITVSLIIFLPSAEKSIFCALMFLLYIFFWLVFGAVFCG